jgi:hypothetical protein
VVPDGKDVAPSIWGARREWDFSRRQNDRLVRPARDTAARPVTTADCGVRETSFPGPLPYSSLHARQSARHAFGGRIIFHGLPVSVSVTDVIMRKNQGRCVCSCVILIIISRRNLKINLRGSIGSRASLHASTKPPPMRSKWRSGLPLPTTPSSRGPRSACSGSTTSPMKGSGIRLVFHPQRSSRNRNPK